MLGASDLAIFASLQQRLGRKIVSARSSRASAPFNTTKRGAGHFGRSVEIHQA
jgi:hypothetical protein